MTEMEWRKKFSSRLINRLYILRMTQQDLAKKSGLTEISISRYVNCKRTPNADSIVRIAKALNCTTDYLIMVDICPDRTELLEERKRKYEMMRPVKRRPWKFY